MTMMEGQSPASLERPVTPPARVEYTQRSTPSTSRSSVRETPSEEYRMTLQSLLHSLDRQLRSKIFAPGHDIRLADWIEVAHRFEKSIIQDLKPKVITPGNDRNPSNNATHQQRASSAAGGAPTTNNFATLPIEIDVDEDEDRDSGSLPADSTRKRTRDQTHDESPSKRIKEEEGEPPALSKSQLKPRPYKLTVNEIRLSHRQICPTFNDNVEVDRRIIPALFKPSTKYWTACTETLMEQTVSILERDIRKVVDQVFAKWADTPIRDLVWGEVRAILAELKRKELDHARHHLDIEREVHFYRRNRNQLLGAEQEEFARLKEQINKSGTGSAAAANGTNRNKEKEKQQQHPSLADIYTFEMTIMAKLGVYYQTAAYRYIDSVILSVNGGMFVKCLPLIHQKLGQFFEIQGPESEEECRKLMTVESEVDHRETRYRSLDQTMHEMEPFQTSDSGTPTPTRSASYPMRSAGSLHERGM